MSSNKKSSLSLKLCVFSSLFVVLKMVTSNNVFLVIFLFLVLGGILCDAKEHKIEYLLFFVSWVYVIKFHPDQFSLFVLISAFYSLVCFLCSLLYHQPLDIKLLLSYLMFIVVITISLLIEGGTLTVTFGFLLNFTALFFAVVHIKHANHFNGYIGIYAAGLILSSLVRALGFIVPNLARFFESMSTVYTVVARDVVSIRFTGMDIDPNYYGIQVLIAVSCLLIVIYNRQIERRRAVIQCSFLALLGLFTLSKMYLFMLFLLLIGALFCFGRRDSFTGNIKRLITLMSVLAMAAYFFFDKLYDAFAVRLFGTGTDFVHLTTGRSERWLMYFMEITHSFRILLIGVGYGNNHLRLMAHNMFLTALYYMGLVGVVVLCIYCLNILRHMGTVCRSSQNKQVRLLIYYLPLFIFLGSNLSLDSLVMNFFPFHLFLVLLAIHQGTGTPDDSINCDRPHNKEIRV